MLVLYNRGLKICNILINLLIYLRSYYTCNPSIVCLHFTSIIKLNRSFFGSVIDLHCILHFDMCIDELEFIRKIIRSYFVKHNGSTYQIILILLLYLFTVLLRPLIVYRNLTLRCIDIPNHTVWFVYICTFVSTCVCVNLSQRVLVFYLHLFKNIYLILFIFKESVLKKLIKNRYLYCCLLIYVKSVQNGANH